MGAAKIEGRIRFVINLRENLCEKSGCFAFAARMAALAVDVRRFRGAFTLHAAVFFPIPDRAGTVWMRALF
ncbi:MAG TPA: hypothetical protein VGF61_23810 [Candidatus Acidoferrum sp.]